MKNKQEGGTAPVVRHESKIKTDVENLRNIVG